MKRNSRKRQWTVIVSIAVLLHLALFYTIKPGFFAIFKKSIDADTGDGRGQPIPPDFIITIPVEIDESSSPHTEQNPVQETTPEVSTDQQVTRNPATPVADEGYSNETAADIEALFGQSPETLPDNIGPEAVVIPPRPLEITWPDTRGLEHCLGHHVDIRIEVSAEGTILGLKAENATQPRDCVEAALRSARLIVFEPGLKDGLPVTMWTRVRIEFRKKD